MVNVGDTVRFHAETEGWSLDDWAMEPGDGFSKFVGQLDGHHRLPIERKAEA